LASGDFHLHKWISNEPEVLKSVLDEKDPGVEKLTFSPPLMVHSMGEDSKRKPLNTAFRIFDPGECFAPSTVRVKMLLQILWQAGASWDDPLPRNAGAHGGLHGGKTVQNILALDVHFITCWCNSKIALAYGRRLIAGRHNGIGQIGHQYK
ncbi:hypothetical protein T06_9737, partial [Trichinella sp. T6]